MTNELFCTVRLRARRWCEGDVPLLHALYGDPEVVRYVGDGAPLSLQDCHRWLEVTRANEASRGYGMFALERRDDRRFVGAMGLVHPGGQADAELKYALFPEHWGLGYATEAARATLTHGETAHHLAAVLATVDPAHRASCRVLEKAGMVADGVRTHPDGTRTLVFRWTPQPR